MVATKKFIVWDLAFSEKSVKLLQRKGITLSEFKRKRQLSESIARGFSRSGAIAIKCGNMDKEAIWTVGLAYTNYSLEGPLNALHDLWEVLAGGYGLTMSREEMREFLNSDYEEGYIP